MSYGAAAALQAAIFARLSSLEALGGIAVVDAAPEDAGGTWVLIGPETVVDRSDNSGAGAEHRVVISVISDAAGFLAAKEAAVAISDGLAMPLDLARGRVAGLWFDRAAARRLEAGRTRRIDLTFRVRIEDQQGE